MNYLAIFIGKSVYLLMRLTGRRGATLPGLVVEKMFPNFLPKMLNQLKDGVIIVSGTNGKTTTTKMLSAIIASNERVITNPSGSNFVRGIISMLIQKSTYSAKLDYDIAIFELDEAYAAKFVEIYEPRGSVILNVMRDQLDRFAEIDHTAKLLSKVVSRTSEFVILNGNDPRVSKMADSTNAAVYFYEVDKSLRSVFLNDDELHGEVEYYTNSTKPKTTLMDFNEGQVVANIDGQSVVFAINSSGLYNAQNAVAACTCALVLGVDINDITRSLSSVKPAFGRGEKIEVNGKSISLQLVKNPGGFRHALLGISDHKKACVIIAINDDYADGRDVSWLWDVSFNDLKGDRIITSGVRASDMALRLKYDDINVGIVESDLRKAVYSSLDEVSVGDRLHIYATYTAMLKIRDILSQITKVDKV